MATRAKIEGDLTALKAFQHEVENAKIQTSYCKEYLEEVMRLLMEYQHVYTERLQDAFNYVCDVERHIDGIYVGISEEIKKGVEKLEKKL